jgi:hypothetical protein
MTNGGTMMKRFYHLLALLAMINLFAVGGLVLYLVFSGRLNAKRADQIAMVLRGEFPTTQAAATQSAPAETPPQAAGMEIAHRQDEKELETLVRTRREREIKDRDTLDAKIQLETRQLLEKLEKKEKELRQEKQQLASDGEQVGFERQLTVLSKIEPKLALQLLKTQMKEPDAVQLLMKMDEGRVKAIVNACKTEDDKAWIGRILNQIGKLGNSTANGVDGPVAPPANGG